MANPPKRPVIIMRCYRCPEEEYYGRLYLPEDSSPPKCDNCKREMGEVGKSDIKS